MLEAVHPHVHKTHLSQFMPGPGTQESSARWRSSVPRPWSVCAGLKVCEWTWRVYQYALDQQTLVLIHNVAICRNPIPYLLSLSFGSWDLSPVSQQLKDDQIHNGNSLRHSWIMLISCWSHVNCVNRRPRWNIWEIFRYSELSTQCHGYGNCLPENPKISSVFV